MAIHKHIVYYTVPGSSEKQTAYILAETRDDAEVAYQAENPTHRIERIMTAVPSTNNPNNTKFL